MRGSEEGKLLLCGSDDKHSFRSTAGAGALLAGVLLGLGTEIRIVGVRETSIVGHE